MAGKNLILQAGDHLFHKGEASDGMFLVRNGELEVYLEQDGKNITLAIVSSGGMIGEMALFDRKPRSASVRARLKSELTLVSNSDFQRLLKQIPKWFTSLMATLSSRLRETNNRLQALDHNSLNLRNQIELIYRVYAVLDLLWSRDGLKEDKEWQLEKDGAINNLSLIFNLGKDFIAGFIDIAIAARLFTEHNNSYNSLMLVSPNRAYLRKFNHFAALFMKTSKLFCLSDGGLSILEAAAKLSEKSAYEKASLSFGDILAEIKDLGGTPGSVEDMQLIAKSHREHLKLLKTSGDVSIRIDRKTLLELRDQHQVLAFIKKKLEEDLI